MDADGMPVTDTEQQGGSVIAWRSSTVCAVHGWLVGWATIVFSSALLVSTRNGIPADLSHIGYDTFQVADAVPPLAKLSLGALYAILIYVDHRTHCRMGPFGGAVAGVLAFLIALMLPVSYYPSGSSHGLIWLGHVACGAAGGLLGSRISARCTRQRGGPAARSPDRAL